MRHFLLFLLLLLYFFVGDLVESADTEIAILTFTFRLPVMLLLAFLDRPRWLTSRMYWLTIVVVLKYHRSFRRLLLHVNLLESEHASNQLSILW